MARVVTAASADTDIEGILTYLAVNAGRRTAAKYHALIERLYDRLAAHPGIGAPRPVLGRNIRIGIVSPSAHRRRRHRDRAARCARPSPDPGALLSETF